VLGEVQGISQELPFMRRCELLSLYEAYVWLYMGDKFETRTLNLNLRVLALCMQQIGHCYVLAVRYIERCLLLKMDGVLRYGFDSCDSVASLRGTVDGFCNVLFTWKYAS